MSHESWSDSQPLRTYEILLTLNKLFMEKRPIVQHSRLNKGILICTVQHIGETVKDYTVQYSTVHWIKRKILNCTVYVVSNCSKWPPSACMHFLTHFSRKYVTVVWNATSVIRLAAFKFTEVVPHSFLTCVHTPCFSYYPVLGNLAGRGPVTALANSA